MRADKDEYRRAEPLFVRVCIFAGVANWRSMYIPALIRSRPFELADPESQQLRDIESTSVPQHMSRILTSLAQKSSFRQQDTWKEAKFDEAAISQSSV